MKKINVGIDISKEKCNLCFRSGLEIVREEECSNDVKALEKAFKAALKVLGASVGMSSWSAPSTQADTSTL